MKVPQFKVAIADIESVQSTFFFAEAEAGDLHGSNLRKVSERLNMIVNVSTLGVINQNYAE